jgi:cell division protein FtsL
MQLTRVEKVQRIVFLIALIVIALDVLFWRS